MWPKNARIHFIAIGGSAMHNLAIALQNKGFHITGSDDAIYEPSKSKLKKQGLLPDKEGWFPEKIHSDLDAVILGMHAQKDNPELLKAQSLGLKLYSYPEFILDFCRDKQRIVIAGSHGKTSITSLVMHVLQFHNRKFDYLVGATVQGFDVNVKLSEDAPLIVIEGDEYPCSPIDATPKFLKYEHHIGLISGIQWDHANIYPTFDDYVKPFELFADQTPKAGSLIYHGDDEVCAIIGNKDRTDVTRISYATHEYVTENNKTYLIFDKKKIAIPLFGKHNMQNISAALQVCKRVGISNEQFYEAVPSFVGAEFRLQLLKENEHSAIYRDFAHAPSKLEASTKAVKEKYPSRTLVACIELHTTSSLDKNFIAAYKDTFKEADVPIVFINQSNFEKKKLAPISEHELKEAFHLEHLKVFFNIDELVGFLRSKNWMNTNLLLMTSGNFGGLDLSQLAEEII